MRRGDGSSIEGWAAWPGRLLGAQRDCRGRTTLALKLSPCALGSGSVLWQRCVAGGKLEAHLSHSSRESDSLTPHTQPKRARSALKTMPRPNMGAIT